MRNTSVNSAVLFMIVILLANAVFGIYALKTDTNLAELKDMGDSMFEDRPSVAATIQSGIVPAMTLQYVTLALHVLLLLAVTAMMILRSRNTLRVLEIGSIAVVALFLITGYLNYQAFKSFGEALLNASSENSAQLKSSLDKMYGDLFNSIIQVNAIRIGFYVGNILDFHRSKGILSYMGDDDHLERSIFARA